VDITKLGCEDTWQLELAFGIWCLIP